MPSRWSFKFCYSFFFNPSSLNPLATHSALNSTIVISLNGLISPFRFLLLAGPALTMLQQSARDRCGLLSYKLGHNICVSHHYSHCNHCFHPLLITLKLLLWPITMKKNAPHPLLKPPYLFASCWEADPNILAWCQYMPIVPPPLHYISQG